MWMHSSRRISLAGCVLLSSLGHNSWNSTFQSHDRSCKRRMQDVRVSQGTRARTTCVRTLSVTNNITEGGARQQFASSRSDRGEMFVVSDVQSELCLYLNGSSCLEATPCRRHTRVTVIGASATLIFGKQLWLCSATGVSALVPTMCLITVCEPGTLLPINGRATPGDVRCQCNT